MTEITPTDPSKIVIATQCSPIEPFKSEVIRLFKSLNLFGGKLAKSKKVVCFSEPPDSDFKNKLEELGVNIQFIEQLDPSYPYANKIQMLQIEEDYDVLVALDTDVLITRDFSDYIDKNKVSAKGVDTDCLGLENWKKLFNFFKLDMPLEKFQTCITNIETVPWFNSGVLFIPKKFISNLYESWVKYNKKLLQDYYSLDFLSGDSLNDDSNFTFIDQYALALAIHDLKLPYAQLPLELNFPTHYLVHKSFQPEKISPLLVHYHHLVSKDGNIFHCKYEKTNALIDNINTKLNSLNLDYELIIDDLYLELLGRHADSLGLTYYSSLLIDKKMILSEIKQNIKNSSEFKNKF